MVAVIDYSTGNLCSVENALRRLGTDYVLVTCERDILKASHVILPGVGQASAAMGALRDTGLDRVIPSLRQPVLGICIGMQLMCERSDEGDVECMGIFGTRVSRLEASGGLKVPHVGWNTVTGLDSPLFSGIRDGEYVYYVHSYAPRLCGDTAAVTEYGIRFSGALRRNNFFGTQFHPEKSGGAGERILENFLSGAMTGLQS